VHQAAATCEDIKVALSNSEDPQLRAFVMLLWLSCGRKGDVANLRQGCVTLEPTGRLNIFMEEGKGVLAKNAKYHVVTHAPEEWRTELRSFLGRQRERRAHLFRRDLATSNEVVELLRTADPSLNCRATRRGAAQTMAASGLVTEETLMRMTGHRSLETMRRYLDWDRLNEEPHLRAQEAAKLLTADLRDNPRQQAARQH
jgi:integrase